MKRRKAGVGDIVAVIFGHIDDSTENREQVLKSALAKAEDLRAQGWDVFFLVLNQVALYEEVASRFKAMSKHDAGITVLYFGNETADAEPEPLADLDAVIGFDFTRAKQQLYPAVTKISYRSLKAAASICCPRLTTERSSSAPAASTGF